MGLGSERDLVPLGAGFDVVRRGYSQAQVEEHLERLDSDLRLIAADRDAAVSQAADLARQMERARTELDELRGQVDRLSLPPTSLEGLSERLQHMLKLAQEESNDTKARGEADAAAIRARSEADATALRERYQKLIVEVDGRRVELETEHRETMEKGRAELAAKDKAAEQERIRLDEESTARRAQVEDDFEIAMAARRTEAMKALAEQEATSKSEAERRVLDATVEAARVRAQIADEQATSKSEAERRLREAADEAARVRSMVAEEQRASKADAEKRLRESTEEANRRRHDAITEAKARVQEAADESHRRVREATEEANRRINHATGRVEALRALRAQIADQLRNAHTLIVNAAPALDPLPEEQPAEAKDRPAKDTSAKDAPKDAGPKDKPADPPAAAPAPVAKTPTKIATKAPAATWPGADAQPTNGGPAKPNTTTIAAANAPTRRTAPVPPPNQANPNQPGATPPNANQATAPIRPAQGVRR